MALIKYRSVSIMLSLLWGSASCFAQSPQEKYEQFRHSVVNEYDSFRDECNRKYADFVRTAWDWYHGNEPLPMPKDDLVPPRPYDGNGHSRPVSEPVDISPVKDTPQPKPVAPVPEIDDPDSDYFTVRFYGVECKVRLPKTAKETLADCKPNTIASAWERLSDAGMNNAIRDCLEVRIRYNLCDWAYLSFLNELSQQFCSGGNGATFLTAYLYCQSGYQMRMGVDGDRLVLLYGSKHRIYNKPYFAIDGTNFYPYGDTTGYVSICNVPFEGETPMSLLISKEQLIGGVLSEPREIVSKRYADISVISRTPVKLIEFFDTYPTSEIGGNPLTRWAMYANTPLSQKTKESVYPSLKKAIENCTEYEAVSKLLNWVQTGFVYEYDNKVWGRDRAFFAEETLYYPFCDCEDRSILFSRLVRDLLGLDVALIFYRVILPRLSASMKMYPAT